MFNRQRIWQSQPILYDKGLISGQFNHFPLNGKCIKVDIEKKILQFKYYLAYIT